MSSKLENVAAMDCNTVANGIMTDIIDVERMESMLGSQLSSEDLFKIDCAILLSLRKKQDFSRDLLNQLEAGSFEDMMKTPKKSHSQEFIQNDDIVDITSSLEKMFNEISDYITAEAFI